jgi:hypothetical protein
MSQQVYEKLAEVQELVENKDYASAQRPSMNSRTARA